MSEFAAPTKCYIAVFYHRHMDPFFENNGFSRGMILFAVPEYGILFKCRADGSRVDLEFGAYFALLRFISTELKKERINSVLVYSCSPEFVFSFAAPGRHIEAGSVRDRLIREYGRKLKIDVALVEPHQNPCLVSPADFPSVPRGREPVLKANLDDRKRSEFRPVQKGIKI